MSIESTLTDLGTDVSSFFTKLKADIAKAKAVWSIISSQQTRALALKLTADAIKLVKDGSAATEATGLNLALDTQTVTDIKTLVADAVAGDEVIVGDLKALGITL